MTQQAETVLSQALDLPERERATIAAALLQSLEPPVDANVDNAWREEVARRIKAVDSGEMATIPWEDLRERLHARLAVLRDA